MILVINKLMRKSMDLQVQIRMFLQSLEEEINMLIQVMDGAEKVQ
jgi:hypothetical protein